MPMIPVWRAVVTRNHDGRPACHWCGQCDRGCAMGSKYGSIHWSIRPALETRRLTLLTDSLAREIVASLRNGADFAKMAQEYSDDASAEDGGEIAPLQPGDVPVIFEETALALQPGELSDVVESSFGFHIIERKDLSRCAAQHILVRYAGAQNAPDSLSRSRAEALTLASEALPKATNPMERGRMPFARVGAGRQQP